MFDNFFDLSYWLTFSPPSVGGTSGNIIFGFFVLFFVLGIAVRIVANNRTEDRHLKTIANRLAGWFITMGLLGIMLYFFSFERIRFFGAKFWYVVWFIIAAIWFSYLLKAFKKVPEIKEQAVQNKEKYKYFPPRKKKRK
jgi:preprotein translocase subunit SecG